MPTAQDVANYLLSDEIKVRIIEVEPVIVTLDGQTYQAARYKSIREYTRDMDAVTRGHKKAGDEYQQEHIYALGRRPVFKRSKVCFVFEGDVRDWFVACYHEGGGAYDEYFGPGSYVPPPPPLGKFFMLMPWDVPNCKIDTYEPYQYKRITSEIKLI
jgi:hypothetical protein